MVVFHCDGVIAGCDIDDPQFILFIGAGPQAIFVVEA